MFWRQNTRCTIRRHHAIVSLFVATAGLLPGCALPTGLLRSRWAMSDAEYADKYCDGAEKSDVLRKLKQAVDARFQEDANGLFVSGGYAKRAEAEHGLFSVDIGAEAYATSYLTGRLSFMGMGNGDDWFTGADAGVRLQTPTRLAPFVGAGVFAGYADETVVADGDWKDNDDDGFIDERGEEEERISGTLAAFYPEVGAHFWWTPKLRLTSYGRYMVTTEGSDANDWQIGVGLAMFTNPGGD